MSSERLLDRRALGQWLGLGPRAISRLAQRIPPTIRLPNGSPRWRPESVEAALMKLSRNRRRRSLPPRAGNGCFVSRNDETDAANVGSSNENSSYEEFSTAASAVKLLPPGT